MPSDHHDPAPGRSPDLPADPLRSFISAAHAAQLPVLPDRVSQRVRVPMLDLCQYADIVAGDACALDRHLTWTLHRGTEQLEDGRVLADDVGALAVLVTWLGYRLQGGGRGFAAWRGQPVAPWQGE